jgi:DNA primase large subunit
LCVNTHIVLLLNREIERLRHTSEEVAEMILECLVALMTMACALTLVVSRDKVAAREILAADLAVFQDSFVEKEGGHSCPMELPGESSKTKKE